MYCHTNIKHDGVFYEAGSQVDPEVFGDAAEVLVELGALDTVPLAAKKNPAAAAEIVARDERIAQLEAQLEAQLAEAGVEPVANDADEEESDED